MTVSRVHSRHRVWLALAATAASLALTAPTRAAEPVPALYDGKNTTYDIMPGSILRRGEGFLSGVVTTVGRDVTIQGDGTCSQAACPVLYNGEHVFARRTRLSLRTGGANNANSGDGRAVKPIIGGGIVFQGTIDHTLRRGDKGEDVLHLQEALNKNGAGMVIDKNFGRGTREAVSNFQRTKGLEADGVAGPATLRALGL